MRCVKLKKLFICMLNASVKWQDTLDIVMVNMRRSTFAAMCEDSVVWVGAVAEVRGWRVSARGTIATLLHYYCWSVPCVSDGRVSQQSTATATTDTEGDTAVVWWPSWGTTRCDNTQLCINVWLEQEINLCV